MVTVGNKMFHDGDLSLRRSKMNLRGASPFTFMENNAVQFVPQYHQTNFYEDEYNNMILQLDRSKPLDDEAMVDPIQQLLELSNIADRRCKGIEHGFMPSAYPVWNKQVPSGVSIDSLLGWKSYQDMKHDMFMSEVQLLEQQDFERSKWCQTDCKIRNNTFNSKVRINDMNFTKMLGDTERVQKKRIVNDNDKEKYVCRHFAEGYCKLGDVCNFQHNVLDSHHDSQKVFLSGLPYSITSETLVLELKKKGYNVINKPKICRRFSPQVCLGSIQEAQNMLHIGKVSIIGCNVDVRPYKRFVQKDLDRQLNINNRSVFIGGVPHTITVSILKAEIEKMGMKVINHPHIKARFIPKVTLATVHQAKQLIAKGEIDLNGATVSVRPYSLMNNRVGKC